MKESAISEKGELIIDGGKYKLDRIAWNPHNTFKGVQLKHLIKGEATAGRLSCHLVRIEPWCELSPHTHDGKLEIHEVAAGSGTCTVAGETFDYLPGIISCIPDNIIHSVKAGGDGLLIIAKFSPALL